jgi:hypothetical protein
LIFDDEWQEYIGFMAKMKDVLSQKDLILKNNWPILEKFITIPTTTICINI